jgi:hypothetical protein
VTESKTLEFVKRKIKIAVRDLLKNKTEAKENVKISSTPPTQIEELPAIRIFSTNESVSRFNEAPKNYKRNVNVAIECLDTGNDDDQLDMRLEILGEQVETLMELDETLGKLVNKLELTGVAYQYEADAQSPVGSIILTFNIEFFSYAQRETVLDDYLSTGVKWEIGHHNSSSDGVKDAEDRLQMRL